jgi:heme-degrading monooxygenase HmoA/hemerythrin-like domain-containing protein
MILAISRFRVANRMEEEVKRAFFNRPHLVDKVPAFLGMETFADADDPTVFYLVTRWTDAESFRIWHKSANHRLSHKFIPKGLKLDPQYTKLTILDRIDEQGRIPEFEEAVTDALPVIVKYLNQNRELHFLVASNEGIVQTCNSALRTRLHKQMDEILGRNIDEFLTDASADFLHRMVDNSKHVREESLLLNFVDANLHPFTLECRLDVRPDRFVIIGSQPSDKERALQEELIALNNQLSVLMRENARNSKALEKTHAELEKAYQDLNESHWHLNKIQEVLPICMMCEKVETDEGKWDDLINYFKKNADFLSHGYCDDCGTEAMAQIEESRRLRAANNVAEGGENGRN